MMAFVLSTLRVNGPMHKLHTDSNVHIVHTYIVRFWWWCWHNTVIVIYTLSQLGCDWLQPTVIVFNLQVPDYHYLYLIPKVIQPMVSRFRIISYGCDWLGNLLGIFCLSFNTTDQYFFNKYELLSRLLRFRTNIPQNSLIFFYAFSIT